VHAEGGLKAGADDDAPDVGFPLIAKTFLTVLECLRGEEKCEEQEEEKAARKEQHLEEGEDLVVGKAGEEVGNKERAGKGKQLREGKLLAAGEESQSEEGGEAREDLLLEREEGSVSGAEEVEGNVDDSEPDALKEEIVKGLFSMAATVFAAVAQEVHKVRAANLHHG
jgi:hypothetical protein